MALYRYRVKTKWGWRTVISSSFGSLEKERNSDKDKGHEVSNLSVVHGNIARVTCKEK